MCTFWTEPKVIGAPAMQDYLHARLVGGYQRAKGRPILDTYSAWVDTNRTSGGPSWQRNGISYML